MNLREWQGPGDTEAMQRLASRLWPRGWHPGGIGWEGASRQLPARTMLAEDVAGAVVGLAGWVGLAGAELVLQVDPAAPDVADALLEWAISTAGATALAVTVYEGDEALRSAVTRTGFVKRASDKAVGMFRAATSARVVLPDGFAVRSVRPGESDSRVQVHRDSWRPLTLPWPGAVPATVTAETTSRFTAEDYERVCRTWLYDPAWDLVVEAPDGSLAACCIAWWDPVTKCAEIEPLGVVPAHRRRGLATALCMRVLAQVAEAGGEQVFINVGPRADYPAPAATYLAAGFEVVGRGDIYERGS